MTSDSPTQLSMLIELSRKGDKQAKGQLLAVAYDHLRSMARRLMRGQRAEHTLQPTALVNEVACQVIHQDALAELTGSEHFFASINRSMRNALIDHERKRRAVKRGGQRMREELAPDAELADPYSNLLEDRLIDLLEVLALKHERAAQVVTFRWFENLTMEEIAKRLRVSLSRVESDWRFARAWLRNELN